MTVKGITLSGDTADRICRESLSQHIAFCREELTRIPPRHINDMVMTDIADDIAMLAALEKVYKYYGGKEE